VDAHALSDFYQMKAFREGWCSLKEPELGYLGDVRGRSVLHLQCHFGQDSLSLARRGALVTGVDFSEPAIRKARALAEELGLAADFVCKDIVFATRRFVGFGGFSPRCLDV
jgi:2-polyprenyl-3-methyl-5-hydroxy-6-metoxy-1,4-benzoquinol methylase